MGLLSSLTTSLIPEPYALLARVGVVLLVLTGAFATGWIKKGEADQNAVNKQLVADQVKIIHIKDTQTIVDNTAVGQLQKQVASLQANNSKLQRQIASSGSLTVVTNGSCVLSKDWVDIYNASVESTP